jgi:hypothetical protein
MTTPLPGVVCEVHSQTFPATSSSPSGVAHCRRGCCYDLGRCNRRLRSKSDRDSYGTQCGREDLRGSR